MFRCYFFFLFLTKESYSYIIVEISDLYILNFDQ